MKVRDIIKDTLWTPGFGYSDDHKPAISVLLPTYRRGASGLFRKAVESVLEQTLEDIELIIIDDASTDGTADQIAEFMRKDGRVSCLRHPRNIGLPAVSEFEAFTKARADFIAFAFDDDFFYADALEKLLEHSLENPGRVCYGQVVTRAMERGSSVVHLGRLGQPLNYFNLRSWNSIPNCAVLLPRFVIEDIGFYDPHIVMSRICDWDLWRRVGERYLLQHVNVDVGEVTGPATDDSLGKTYALVPGASEEWMRSGQRSLAPNDILEVDVFSSRLGISSRTTGTIEDLAANHITNRPWLSEESSLRGAAQDKSIFVLTQRHDASTTLCFDYLPRAVRGSMRIIRSQGGFPLSELAHASCIIVVRHFDVHGDWIDAAVKLGIPMYYFIDDNIMELVLKESYKDIEDFSLNAIRLKLRNFSGVLVSTSRLAEYFEANLLHKNVCIFPISYAASPPKLPVAKRKTGAGLTIASVGGKHRHRGLKDYVLPALRQIADKTCKIHIVVGGCFPEDYDNFKEIGIQDENFEITLLPFDVDWNRAVLQISEYNPDIVVHSPSQTANNKYKTLNVALCAYLLNALLVVPNDEPYDTPEFDASAIRVEPSQEPRAWFLALKEIISTRETWDRYKQANATFCRTHFSGEQNLIVLNEILENAPVVNPTLVESRLKEMYFSKASASTSSPDAEPLRMSLLELSSLRSRIRRYRRFKPRLSHEDLWPRISPAFEDIRQYILANRIRTANSYLELSDAIQDKDFVEYPILLKSGTLRSISCAFSSEGFHEGFVGVELVDPDGKIVTQSGLPLESVNLQFPITFDLKETVVPQGGTWQLRLFARSKWPVYALEFATYSRFGWTRQAVAPFAKVEYADKAQVVKNVANGRAIGGVSTTPVQQRS